MKNLQHFSFNEEGSKLLQRMYNPDSKSQGITINLYIRYGHTIDYPEIAELLAIFLDKMTQEKKFKFLSRVQIIPRISNAYKPINLLNHLKNTDYLIVIKQEFINAINGGVTIYLSHSKDEVTKMPHIISGSMVGNSKSYHIPLELEFGYSSAYKKKTEGHYNTKEILNIFYKQLKKIERDLEKKLPSNTLLARMQNLLKK